MRISDWSSDVCSSDLLLRHSCRRERQRSGAEQHNFGNRSQGFSPNDLTVDATWRYIRRAQTLSGRSVAMWGRGEPSGVKSLPVGASVDMKERRAPACGFRLQALRSEAHTSELQTLMRTS